MSSNDDTRRPSRSAATRSAAMRGALGKATPRATGGSGRRAQVATAVFIVLGVGMAYGYATMPTVIPRASAAAATTTAIASAVLTCPIVTGSGDASVSAYTPVGKTAPSPSDTAFVRSFKSPTPLFTLNRTGVLSVSKGLSGDIANIDQESIPVGGVAVGGYAPGFTLTETLASGAVGSARGLASTACTAPDTDFWYIGASGAAKATSALNLVDPDQTAAQVNLAAYTAAGPVAGSLMQLDQGLLVAGGTEYTRTIDLANFTSAPEPIAVHVTATSGRVAAALLDADGTSGGRDFITAQKPAASLVIPGIPAPATGSAMKLQLSLFAPTADTDVTLHWIGASTIAPMVSPPHLAAGRVAHVDLSAVPVAGEAAALQIDSSNGTPIIAEVKVSGVGGPDTAFLSPVAALTGESIVADDNTGDTSTASVQLTNTAGTDAQVQVSTAATDAPTPQTVTVPAHSTKAVALHAPPGATSFALSVIPLSGANAVYAARIMTAPGGLITIQPMSTALETVQVPAVRNDLSGAVPQ